MGYVILEVKVEDGLRGASESESEPLKVSLLLLLLNSSTKALSLIGVNPKPTFGHVIGKDHLL